MRPRSDSRAARTAGCIDPSSHQGSAWSACARVGHVTHLDVGHRLAWTRCMDHLAVARVEPHMANTSVEEDQVPVPELGLRDLLANAVLLSGRMPELDPAACQAFIVRPEQSQLGSQLAGRLPQPSTLDLAVTLAGRYSVG